MSQRERKRERDDALRIDSSEMLYFQLLSGKVWRVFRF